MDKNLNDILNKLMGKVSKNSIAIRKLNTLEIPSPSANRNILINADFRINQRVYVSAAALAAGVYAHDRWKGGAGGGTYSFTQLASPTTITIAANKTLIQVVEDKNVIGGTYTLSWEGTCQARYAVDSATPAGAYADSPITIAGQTAGTTMSVEFGNGAASGTLGKVQLEADSVATPYEFRLIPEELALCEWYYRIIGKSTGPQAALHFGGYGYGTQNETITLSFQDMRTTPTATKVGTWTVGNCAQPTIGALSPNTVRLYTAVTATGAYAFYTANNTN